MAAAPTPLTLQEFHRLYHDGDKPRYEYWFGEAIQKPMRRFLHGAVQFIVMFLLNARGWNVFPEVRLKLHPEAEPVPDVIAGAFLMSGLSTRRRVPRETEISLRLLFAELGRKMDRVLLTDEDFT